MKVEALFENQTTLNRKAYIEMAISGSKTIISIVMIIAAFGFVDTGYTAYTIKEYTLTLICLLSAIIAFATPFYMYRILGVKNYKNQMVISDGIEPQVNITIFDESLTFTKFIPKMNEDMTGYRSDVATTIEHDKITVVYSYKECFVIVYANQIYLPIQKEKFSKGTSDEFEVFLMTKGIKLKRKIL